MEVKRGAHFLHKHWKDSRFSLSQMRDLPADVTALEHVISRVAKGVVYFRPVYRHSGVITNLGAPSYLSIEEFQSAVLREIPNSEAAIRDARFGL